MTIARPAALLLLIAAAIAAIGVILMPTPAHAMTGHTTEEQVVIGVAVGKAADYDPATAAAILTAADQVCEGFTAEVPLTTMEQTVTEASGLPPATAHVFVAVALRLHCGIR